jgi:cytochrome c oxidase subunit II
VGTLRFAHATGVAGAVARQGVVGTLRFAHATGVAGAVDAAGGFLKKCNRLSTNVIPNDVRDLKSATVAAELQIVRSPGLLLDDVRRESGAFQLAFGRESAGAPGAARNSGASNRGTAGDVRPRRPWAALALLGVTGCTGPQHVMDPAGPAAERIAGLFWVMLAIATAVVVLVVALTAVAVLRGRRRAAAEGAAGGVEPRAINGAVLVWSLGVALPLAVVMYLVVASARVGVAAYRPPDAPANPLVIEVIGHMFWWEIRYPQFGVTTANEIYMPAGEQVLFHLESPDVIHSFWVPRLQGKMDMIPGRRNSLWMRADEPGLFRGACAEYCGAGHALMAFWVEAMPRAEFEAWLAHRQAPPAPLADAEVARGRQVFFETQCHLCHAVPGAPLPEGLGEVGPDLSDFGRRRTIAAGTRPNDAVNLVEWLVDPVGVKPGARMPATEIDEPSMAALVAYLRALR